MRAGSAWVLALVALACDTAGGGGGPAHQSQGEVRRSCAPWDGPALRLDLPADSAGAPERPALQIYLYRHGGSPDAGRYRLGGSDSEGSAVWCPPGRACSDPAEGEVWLDTPSEGRPVTGRYRIQGIQGQVLEGRFQARWGPEEGPCG